jgi:hypothetical protein
VLVGTGRRKGGRERGTTEKRMTVRTSEDLRAELDVHHERFRLVAEICDETLLRGAIDEVEALRLIDQVIVWPREFRGSHEARAALSSLLSNGIAQDGKSALPSASGRQGTDEGLST